MIEALDWLENFLSNSAVSVIESTPDALRQALRWMRQFSLGRKRILDTQLAAIFHTTGVNRLLTSNPADLKVYQVFEIITS